MKDQLLETWAINERVNAFFLDEVAPEALWVKPPKGKAVGGQFSHLHTVRMMWLKVAAPELMEGLAKVEEGATIETLKAGLSESSRKMASVLERSLDEGRVKGFKPHACAFLCYLLAHEAHHRGQAELILRQLGHPLSDRVGYGIWEWGTR